MMKINDSQISPRVWTFKTRELENLYVWSVKIVEFDSGLMLAKDLVKNGYNGVELELRFPAEFPVSPPFIRVVSPRLLRFMEGGGGHVTGSQFPI
jgi:ubiquitin-conjugating enzyme E2 Q